MKKIFNLVMFGLMAFATSGNAQDVDQTFRFVDKTGTTVYENGTVLNLTNVIQDELGSWNIPTKLYLQNTTNNNEAVKVSLDMLTNEGGGTVQFCMLGKCNSYGEVGNYEKHGVERAKAIDDLMLEWFTPADIDDAGDFVPLPGSASITLKAEMLSDENDPSSVIASGPQISIFFSYNPTGIENIENPDNGKVQELARYNANGQKVTAPVRGLNIVKLANGKIVKQLFK